MPGQTCLAILYCMQSLYCRATAAHPGPSRYMSVLAVRNSPCRRPRGDTVEKNGTEFRFQTDTKNRNEIPFSDGHKKSERNSVFSDGHGKRNGIPFSEIGIESDKVSGNI